MIAIVLCFSLLLESTISNIIDINSIFVPLFLITALVNLYPYFKKINKFNFFLVCMIVGIVYDIVFTNSLFVNTLAYTFIGFLISVCYSFVKYNIYTSNIINIIMLISYRIFTYIMLLSLNYISFNNKIFFKGIYSSLLINIIYCIILYILVDFLAIIFNKNRVE